MCWQGLVRLHMAAWVHGEKGNLGHQSSAGGKGGGNASAATSCTCSQ